jgi:hypothetical protein
VITMTAEDGRQIQKIYEINEINQISTEVRK